MYKNLKTSAVECLENGNQHMYRTTFFTMKVIKNYNISKIMPVRHRDMGCESTIDKNKL